MLRDDAPKPARGTVTRARKLRQTMSLPEVLLWRALRGQPAGLKVRRQHPTGRFVLDFYCGDARLGIEVDGEVHAAPGQTMHDAARDAWLATQGIATMRIPAAAVLHDVGAVADAIVATCLARLPLHHPALPDGPPPRAELGED